MGGSDCSEEICAGDKEENMIREAMKKGQTGIVQKSRSTQILQNSKPLNAVILGRVTWPLLHRMSLSYPDTPTDGEKQAMTGLINAFSWMYPCSICATDFREEIKKSPPKVDSKEDLAMWLCEQHNIVNDKLGKGEFKCSLRRLQMVHGQKITKN